MKTNDSYITMLIGAAIGIGFLFGINSPANALDYHINCNQCHNIHTGPGTNLLHAANAETVCLSCHDGSAAGAPQVTIHQSGGTFLATCVDCHDTHKNRTNYLGNTNTSLVGISYDVNGNAQGNYDARVMDNNGNPTAGDFYTVDFEAPTPRFVRMNDQDGVPGSRRICQVCHVAPPTRRHPRVSETGCMGCHDHNLGFMRN